VPVAVATAVLATAALAMAGRATPTVGRRRDRVWILLGLVVVALAALLAVPLQQRIAPEAGYAPLPELVDPSVRPPWQQPAAPTPTAQGPTGSAASPTPTEAAPDGTSLEEVLSRALVALWWLLWLAVLAVLMLRAGVALAWWRYRRTLHAGPPAAQVVGAWTYLRARLRSLGRAWAPSFSPDEIVVRGDGSEAQAGGAPGSSESVRELARLVAPSAFAAGAAPTTDDVDHAWACADRAVHDARAGAGWPRRLRAGFSAPGGSSRRR
jgi:hypothetical protein